MSLVRPDAFALLDAFGVSDFRLARYDGDIYQALLEAAMKDKMEPGPGYMGI